MKEQKEILCKRLDKVGLRVFWEEVNAAYADGFKFDPTETALRKMPVCRNIIRVTLFKGEDEVVQEDNEIKEQSEKPEIKAEEKVEEKEVQLSSLAKKKDLLDFAKNHDIIIPDEDQFKFVGNIKKYIKEVLEGRS